MFDATLVLIEKWRDWFWEQNDYGEQNIRFIAQSTEYLECRAILSGNAD